MLVCPRRGKDRAPVALKGGRAHAPPPFITRKFCCGLLSFQICHLSVTDDVPATATVFLFFCCSDYCLSCSSSACAFSGRPPAGRAVVNGASGAVSAPGGLPSLTQNPRLAATVPVARLCRAVACALGIPAKGRRDVRRNAVSQTALHVVAAGPCPLLCPVPFTCLSPLSPGAKTATTVSASPRVKCTSRKTFCPKAGKNFCGLPPDSRFLPWQ